MGDLAPPRIAWSIFDPCALIFSLTRILVFDEHRWNPDRWLHLYRLFRRGAIVNFDCCFSLR
jgi:hypothetical protein